MDADGRDFVRHSCGKDDLESCGPLRIFWGVDWKYGSHYSRVKKDYQETPLIGHEVPPLGKGERK
jgi:hypothetical protein